MSRLLHASFFSGVGGLDLGLERAGWRTVSFSEIDPYACAVLAERWPGIPNLGDVTAVALPSVSRREVAEGLAWQSATLWSAGFPCTDLSVAGERVGLRDAQGNLTRSGLAFAFLDLVERHRPPAVLLENVPGLLSSHGGRDLGALLDRLGQLGYGWAYRVLDAQFFGVPQRRRRVFVLAFHAVTGLGADSAAEVLAVGTRCGGHSQAGVAARTTVAAGAGNGVEIAGSLTRRYGKGVNTTVDDGAIVVSPPPDADGMRASDGLAGRVDDQPDVAYTLTAPGMEGGRRDRIPLVAAYRKSARVNAADSPETWVDDGLANTLTNFDVGDIRTTHAIVGGDAVADDPLLPLGLDSHRYRCCGNGVVAPVAEWIGRRLASAMAGWSVLA